MSEWIKTKSILPIAEKLEHEDANLVITAISQRDSHISREGRALRDAEKQLDECRRKNCDESRN